MLLRAGVAEEARCNGVFAVLQDNTGEATHVERLSARMRAVFRAPLEEAQGVGIVRRDLTVEEMLTIFAMLGGAIAGDAAARGAVASRGLELLLGGLITGPART